MTAQLPLLLEPADLAAHLDDDNLLIVDLSKDQVYDQAHVPGAVHLDFKRLLAGTQPAPGLLPGDDALSALFSELGLTPDARVVAYDDEGGGWAGRLLWTLELIGHSRYSYLNGGIHAWRQEGLATESTPNEPRLSDYEAEIRHPEVSIDAEGIQERLNDRNFAVWDARSRAEYDGEKGQNKHLGHIPGAVNLDWLDVMDRDNALRIRDYAELVTELEALGLTPDMDIVTHCQSHHRSGLTWLAGRALGFTKIRAYPGSWKDWGNRDDTPIEH